MYKVEPFVKRCVLSLENQDIPSHEYEIICINDGSPDNSREVILQLQKEYNNIVLIDQENQGVSRARNNGINIASGRYLIFIDPDDYVEPNSFNCILKNAESFNSLVAFLGFSIMTDEGSVHKNLFYNNLSNKVYPGSAAYTLARGDGFTDPDRIWGVLFDKDFINSNNLRFLPDVPYLEDGEFIARILSLAERCTFISHSFYLRTKRKGSATNSNLFNSEFAINGFIKAAVNLRNFRDTFLKEKKQKEFINQPIVKFVVLSISSAGKLSKFKLFLKVNSMLKAAQFNRLDLKACNRYYQKLGILYNLSGFVLYTYLVIRPLALLIVNIFRKLIRRKKIF